MLGEVITIVLFFVVIALTAVIFFGWIALVVLRIFFSGVAGVASLFMPSWGGGRHGGPAPRTIAGMLRGQADKVPVTHLGATVRCGQDGCYAVNPRDARFCRRCGRGLPAGQRVAVRRAAVW